jgi:non-specific serine/threonine protein kinase
MEESQVVQSIAKALGIHESPDGSLREVLIDYLRNKQMLIVLDNCEHLVSECAQVAAQLLSKCAGLDIIATSRESLGIEGEILYRVPPLAVPSADTVSDLEYLSDFEAVRLFVERARAVSLGFKLSMENIQAVALICRRLDGIPLAIELAAARTKLLAPEHIAARLDDRFALLTNGSRIALPRHQTLRAAIDWSYDPLPETARLLLARLSVFAGGFGMGAAEAVCSDNFLDSSATLVELSRLVDRSLIQVEQKSEDERFFMLETIRQYADEKLQAAGEKERFRDRHLQHYMKMARDLEPALTSFARETGLNRLEVEYDNLHAALVWAKESGRRREMSSMAGDLAWFWNLRGYLSEGLDWLSNASSDTGIFDAPAGSVDQAKVLYGKALIADTQGAHTQARAWLEECVELWRGLGIEGKRHLALALALLGDAVRALGVPVVARKFIEEAETFFRAERDEWGLAYTLGILGWVIRDLGDFEKARALVKESVTIWRVMGDNRGLGNAFHVLGAIAYRAGDYAEASSYFSQAATIRQEMADRAAASYSLQNLGITTLNQGNHVKAKELFEMSSTLAREMGMKGNLTTAIHYFGYLAMFTGDLQAADSFFRQSLSLTQEWGPKWISGMDVAGLGGVAAMRNQHERAARLWGAGEEHMRAVASFMDDADRNFFERTVAKSRKALGEIEFQAALSRGRAMDLTQAIDLALHPEE